MERATKIFNTFDEGIREVMGLSNVIRHWLINAEKGFELKLKKTITEKDVVAILAQRSLLDRPTSNKKDWNKEMISINAFGITYVSKEYLIFEWRVKPKSNSTEVEYFFVISGIYLEKTTTLNQNILDIGGWKCI